MYVCTDKFPKRLVRASMLNAEYESIPIGGVLKVGLNSD